MARIEEVLAGDETWGAYALDVAGHTALGIAYALPVVAAVLWFGWSPWWAFLAGEVAAIVGGATRELLQGLKTRSWHLRDRVLDVLHHALGPPIALGLVLLTRALIA